jgi:hypothetical protein
MMNFINTCISNYQEGMAHAPPVDWSGLGGVPWLIGTVAALLTLLCWAALASAAAAREADRLELYDSAEAEGQLRAARREAAGYLEYRR